MMAHLCAWSPALASRIGSPPASDTPVLDVDGDGDDPEPVDPADPGELLAEADVLVLPLACAPPGVGLLPGCPVADLDLDAAPPALAWARAAAADADWLACHPEPASSACCGDELPAPNGLSATTPTASTATTATDTPAMTAVRLRLPGPAGGRSAGRRSGGKRGPRRRGAGRRLASPASGGRSAVVMAVVCTACSGSGQSCGPGGHSGGEGANAWPTGAAANACRAAAVCAADGRAAGSLARQAPMTSHSRSRMPGARGGAAVT